MSANAEKPAGPVAWSRRIVGPRGLLIAVVTAALLVLSAVTAVLASFHHRVRRDLVARHLERGEALVAISDLRAAAAEYRAVLLLERDHAEAEHALALTLLSLGESAESESHLRHLLQRDPTNGPLNRGLARIHAARGRDVEARMAYQRAIYGQWPAGPVAGRTDTRFEFIDYLTRIGAGQEVLAELLRLRDEFPTGNTVAARRAAELLVERGAGDLAIETLRTATLTASRDVDLLAHLAELQAVSGHPTDARATLRRAVELEPRRRDLIDRLHVLERVLALDPTLPRLGLVTRTRRAFLVLSEVLQQTERCGLESANTELRAVSQAGRARARRTRRADAEAAEESLALAGRIWALAPGCHDDSPEARALAQVLERTRANAVESPS